MGYRSNITFQMNIEGIEPQKILNEFKRRLDKVGEDLIYLFDNVYVNDNCLTIEIQDAKWYDSCKDVQTVMNYLDELGNTLEKYETEGFIHYIRIGENPSDIDERCYGDISYSTLCIECYVETSEADIHKVDLKEYLASSIYDY